MKLIPEKREYSLFKIVIVLKYKIRFVNGVKQIVLASVVTSL